MKSVKYRPLPGYAAAVRREIVDGNIQAALNMMANWTCFDWRFEEAMIAAKQALRKAA